MTDQDRALIAYNDLIRFVIGSELLSRDAATELGLKLLQAARDNRHEGPAYEGLFLAATLFLCHIADLEEVEIHGHKDSA